MPSQRRPSPWAASMAVPQPQKGSSTTSPGLLLARNDALQQGERFLGWVAEAFAMFSLPSRLYI